MVSLSLTTEGCKSRQQWLSHTLAQKDIPCAVLARPEHVQYFTGFRPHRLMEAAVLVSADGNCALIAPNAIPDHHAANEVLTFGAQWHSTLRQDQVQAIARVLKDAMSPRQLDRIAIEGSAFPSHYRDVLPNSQPVDIEPDLFYRRRSKDPDEMAMIQRAIDCTEAMYHRAKEIIAPGITELEVFNQLQAAAVEVAGEPLTDLGNDYRANAPGGSPRPREAQSGELFILDLGPAYRGYYADNCRTFAVNGKPTEAQQQAWEAIVGCLDEVEKMVKPGVKCKDVFNRAREILDRHKPDAFTHHLGHGFGLFPHEAPHLNPHWDDSFEELDVFTMEPGLYTPELKAGIRLEQNYQVTANGIKRLTSFPLDLT